MAYNRMNRKGLDPPKPPSTNPKDPPPIVRTNDEYYPPRPPEMSKMAARRRYRTPKRVSRPAAFNVALVLLFFLLSCSGLGSCWFLAAFGGTLGALAGVPTAGAGAGSLFLVGIIFPPLFSAVAVWFAAWLFDSWTEYHTNVIHEGTARALAELD